MRHAGMVIALAIGCGDHAARPPDAAIDAPPDAPPDASVDAPPTAVGPHYHYVVDHEYVPANNTQAREFGLDLNGDGVVDNQLGMVLGTFSGMGFDVQAVNTTAVDTGGTIVLVDVQATDFTNALDTGVTTYLGTNPNPPACSGPTDTTCRHQLTGTATFDIATASPRDPALLGPAVSGTFADGPGHLAIQLAVASPTAPLELDLVGARVQLSGVTATAIASGIVAGGVTQSDVNTKIVPSMQQSFVPIIARDCCGAASSPQPVCNPNSTPSCGCVSGSTGKTLLGLFDTSPKDCAISVSEIQNNALIQSLLAPDVTLEGQACLSIGVKITAVGAMFTP